MSREKLKQALSNWQEKLADYEYEKSISASPEQRFELKKKIDECQEEINKLEERIAKLDKPAQFPPKATAAEAENLESEDLEPEDLEFSVPAEPPIVDLSAIPTKGPEASEIGADYTKLAILLELGDFNAADEETWSKQNFLDGDVTGLDINGKVLGSLPCKDLQTIDRLWFKHSGGKFGLSVQQKIWTEVGGKIGSFDEEIHDKFAENIGWKSTEPKTTEEETTEEKSNLSVWQLGWVTGKDGKLADGSLPTINNACSFHDWCPIMMSAQYCRLEPPRFEWNKVSTGSSSPIFLNGSEASDLGIDYTTLAKLLEAEKFQAANQKTKDKIREIQKRSTGSSDWPSFSNQSQFHYCKDLHTINRLWLHYSNYKFGFSVQREIWKELHGSLIPGGFDSSFLLEFEKRVGWKSQSPSIYFDRSSGYFPKLDLSYYNLSYLVDGDITYEQSETMLFLQCDINTPERFDENFDDPG